MSLVKEPINLVIVAAFVLLMFGFNLDSLPSTISSVITRLSAMMGPLVLLFIGMAVKIRKSNIGFIFRMLSLRSGLAFLLCVILTMIIPSVGPTMGLLLLVFAQSSVSFWPYAHISLVNEMESKTDNKTFDSDMALSVLALSLPFSTLVILGILSFPSITVSPIYPALVGLGLVSFFLSSSIVRWVKRPKHARGGKLEVSQAQRGLNS